MIGKLLGNRYEILEQIGGGGMAIVYKGRDALLNRLVTIKNLRPEFTCDEEFVKRFRREAQAVASLSHPNIVSIYDVGQEGEVYYLVMEYVEGDNLKNLIRGEGMLPPERATEIARQVCEALQHAHENNIVHRDVKPQNILITKGGQAKLTDFGIAREATTATLTQTDTIVGSVHYLSPEQARGETAGPQSDIYSLGVVLYEMVTGALPFQGDTPIGVALKHIQEDPARPSSLNPAVTPALENIIFRAMAKLPADRFGSARDMVFNLEALSHVSSGVSGRFAPVDEFATKVIPAVRASEKGIPLAAEDKPTPTRKRRTGWLWAALIFLGLLVAGYVAFQLYVNVPEIEMPPVEGKTLEEAQDVLRGQGISNIDVSWNPNPNVPRGSVISQEPRPGEKIKVTRNVILSVSLGPEYRVVPQVIGLDLNAARIEISRSELNVRDTREIYSSEHSEGTVADVEPKPGKEITKGSGVILYVSKGPQPVTRQVPDLTGLSVDAARAELDKVKLKLDENIIKAGSTDYLPGQVIAQNPAKGTGVQEGTTVQVTISSGPGPNRRYAKVEVRIPDDEKKHELKIVVKDTQGSKEAHVGIYSPGKLVVREVPHYGKARIQVYIDEKIVKEEDID